jgi:glutamine amidotransferase
MDVAIIDYRMGNLHSVQAACTKVGLSSAITADVGMIMDARATILPGVGAFGEAMSHLSRSGLDDCIHRFVESGRPFVGICLGLQLLFDRSEEFGMHEGLGIISGTVRKFRLQADGSLKYPVPQIGWNLIRQQGASWEGSLLCDNRDGDFMYFVHSYYVEPDDRSVVLASTDYGGLNYCSAIRKDNVFATQFHPEKSGRVGMRIYQQLKNNLESK